MEEEGRKKLLLNLLRERGVHRGPTCERVTRRRVEGRSSYGMVRRSWAMLSRSTLHRPHTNVRYRPAGANEGGRQRAGHG